MTAEAISTDIKQQARQRAHGIAAALTRITGTAWHAVQHSPRGREGLMESEKGVTLQVTAGAWNEPDRLSIYAVDENHEYSLSYYGYRHAEEQNRELVTSIKVSVAKTDEQVAKDIVRRLLPDAQIASDRCHKRLADQRDYEQRRDAATQALAAALHWNVVYPSNYNGDGKYERTFYLDRKGRYDAPGVDVEVSGHGNGSALGGKLTFDYLPIEVAEKLLRVFAAELAQPE